MGEAKRRREAQRKLFLAECDLWGQEPTQEEVTLLAQIGQMKKHTIQRVPPEQLAYMRMLPQECHQNCFSYVRLDPNKESRMLSGWWYVDDGYVAHSVVQNDTGMFCITPHFNLVDTIEFIPDSQITWHEGPDGRATPLRNGQPIPKVLRTNPRKRIAQVAILRQRLLSGMDPMKALSLPPESGTSPNEF